MTAESRASIYAGPVKRSVTIAAHETSITLEPLFWQAIEAAARRRNLPLSALIAAIDAQRIAADEPPNLASAIRCWILAEASSGGPITIEPLVGVDNANYSQ
ncbi:ribbon-helix-helix domain-containing protein [uncultured Sphingomonas sp.]|uniref:ribbon-helix-helix domain-containing protein n=1 Tax=uncultured Sphingomonas sp. TaxID=158754 RepID=UPI0035CBE84E